MRITRVPVPDSAPALYPSARRQGRRSRDTCDLPILPGMPAPSPLPLALPSRSPDSSAGRMLRDALWAPYPPEDCRCTWGGTPRKMAGGLAWQHKLIHAACLQHGDLPNVPWDSERWVAAAGQPLPPPVPLTGKGL
jgi:hypothetical protein